MGVSLGAEERGRLIRRLSASIRRPRRSHALPAWTLVLALYARPFGSIYFDSIRIHSRHRAMAQILNIILQ